MSMYNARIRRYYDDDDAYSEDVLVESDTWKNAWNKLIGSGKVDDDPEAHTISISIRRVSAVL